MLVYSGLAARCPPRRTRLTRWRFAPDAEERIPRSRLANIHSPGEKLGTPPRHTHRTCWRFASGKARSSLRRVHTKGGEEDGERRRRERASTANLRAVDSVCLCKRIASRQGRRASDEGKCAAPFAVHRSGYIRVALESRRVRGTHYDRIPSDEFRRRVRCGARELLRPRCSRHEERACVFRCNVVRWVESRSV